MGLYLEIGGHPLGGEPADFLEKLLVHVKPHALLVASPPRLHTVFFVAVVLEELPAVQGGTHPLVHEVIQRPLEGRLEDGEDVLQLVAHCLHLAQSLHHSRGKVIYHRFFLLIDAQQVNRQPFFALLGLVSARQGVCFCFAGVLPVVFGLGVVFEFFHEQFFLQSLILLLQQIQLGRQFLGLGVVPLGHFLYLVLGLVALPNFCFCPQIDDLDAVGLLLLQVLYFATALLGIGLHPLVLLLLHHQLQSPNFLLNLPEFVCEMDAEFEGVVLEVELVEDPRFLVLLLESHHEIASEVFELLETAHEAGLAVAEVALQFGHLPGELLLAGDGLLVVEVLLVCFLPAGVVLVVVGDDVLVEFPLQTLDVPALDVLQAVHAQLVGPHHLLRTRPLLQPTPDFGDQFDQEVQHFEEAGVELAHEVAAGTVHEGLQLVDG